MRFIMLAKLGVLAIFVNEKRHLVGNLQSAMYSPELFFIGNRPGRACQ